MLPPKYSYVLVCFLGGIVLVLIESLLSKHEQHLSSAVYLVLSVYLTTRTYFYFACILYLLMFLLSGFFAQWNEL